MSTQSRRREAGFTLVELIVTISILTVLAGILIPSINSYIDKGNNSKAHADLREMANVFNKYKVDCGFWPTTDNNEKIGSGKADFVGYACLFSNAANYKKWDGPYVNEGVMVDGKMHIAKFDAESGVGEGLMDPWGAPYRVYSFKTGHKATTGALVIMSGGKNGKFETKTDDIFEVRAAGDDILQLITYNVN